MEYDGGRTAADIIQWAEGKAAENIPPPEIQEVNVRLQIYGLSMFT